MAYLGLLIIPIWTGSAQHAGALREQASRQMALSQQEPIIASELNQSPAVLTGRCRRAGERPRVDPRRNTNRRQQSPLQCDFFNRLGNSSAHPRLNAAVRQGAAAVTDEILERVRSWGGLLAREQSGIADQPAR